MVAEEPQQKKVVVCPLCAKAVLYFPEQESADAAVDRHTARECDPANYNRVHNKQRCPVPGCKERVTATNVYRCRDCGVEVCMKHRYDASDHACAGKPVPGPSAAARRQLGSLLRGLRMNDAAARPAATSAAKRQMLAAAGRSPKQASSSSASSSSGGGMFSRAAAALQNWRSNPTPTQADPANSLRGSAARRQQQHRQQQERQQQERQQQSQQPAALPFPPTNCRQQQDLRPVEVCADCGARFDSVAELIAHAEAAHMGAAR